MKSLHQVLVSKANLWQEIYNPHIYTIWKGKPVIGKGSTGTVYDISEQRVAKVQPLFSVPLTDSNDSFYINIGPIVYIKESFLQEVLVMQTLHTASYIIPAVYDFAFGDVDGKFYSVVVMQKVQGNKYVPQITPFQELVPLWIDFLTELQKLYQKNLFIHGDLITENMMIHPTRGIVLLDFGLSSFQYNNVLFVRYHSFQKNLVPTLLRDNVMIKKIKHAFSVIDCSTVFRFIQEHRQSIDICKLLSYSLTHFSPSFKKQLKTCIGPENISLSQSKKPNPIYYSRNVITFAQAIHALKNDLA